jgi:4-oxalocrotonate tautomerase family enzyme
LLKKIGEYRMPVVTVEMVIGRNDEQKETLIRGIARAFEEIGVKPEGLTIILHETPRNNGGIHGTPAPRSNP